MIFVNFTYTGLVLQRPVAKLQIVGDHVVERYLHLQGLGPFYWGYIGIMEKKMETSVNYVTIGYIAVMVPLK